MSEEDLPEDLREVVEEAKARSLPKPRGAGEIAEEILSWSGSSR